MKRKCSSCKRRIKLFETLTRRVAFPRGLRGLRFSCAAEHRQVEPRDVLVRSGRNAVLRCQENANRPPPCAAEAGGERRGWGDERYPALSSDVWPASNSAAALARRKAARRLRS